MTDSPKKQGYQLLFLIATPKLVHKAVDLFQKGMVPVQYRMHAQGTASSEMMDMLGLGGVEKDLAISILPRPFASRMLKKLQQKLHLGMPNTGIAFTVAMSGCSSHMIRLMETLPEQEHAAGKDEWENMEKTYCAIMAIVNQGFSGEVMNVARPMGAAGGTVFHSRRVGSEEATQFWGISIQEEREVVLILAEKDDKKDIMKAINGRCGMGSEAQGVVLSLPVDEIIGIG
ncbi:MAG: transposase [Eubacterium sp.]|nr:transposase [Eubacterium sp.]